MQFYIKNIHPVVTKIKSLYYLQITNGFEIYFSPKSMKNAPSLLKIFNVDLYSIACKKYLTNCKLSTPIYRICR